MCKKSLSIFLYVGLLLKLTLVPLNGYFPSVVSSAPLSLVPSENVLRVHSISLSMSLIKVLKSTGPKTDPWGTLLVTSLYLGIELLTATLCVAIQPIPYPPSGPPIISISLHFGDKDVMWNHVKGLTEGQVDDIGWSSFVNWCRHSITENQ